MTEDVSGRAVLKSSAAATVAAVGLSGCTDGSEGVDGETSLVAANWEAAETPTEETLYDVAYTSDGPYVVGAAGLVLGRTGEGWEKVLDGGPTGNGNDLYGADVTDDGDRLWFVGASGAIGEYDVTAGSLNDYSAPDDVTNNFNDVAVTAAAGEANTFVAGDSGKMYVNFDNGASGKWDSTTPGSGAAVQAIDFHDDCSGHAVDGNQTVFRTDDGSTYESFGIQDANDDFFGVDSDSADDVTVAGGGSVRNWDGSEWVPEDNGDPTLRDVEMDGASGLTVGGGVVFRRDEDGWVQEGTTVGGNLRAVLRADDHGYDRDIAVGAAGTVIENP